MVPENLISYFIRLSVQRQDISKIDDRNDLIFGTWVLTGALTFFLKIAYREVTNKGQLKNKGFRCL